MFPSVAGALASQRVERSSSSAMSLVPAAERAGDGEIAASREPALVLAAIAAIAAAGLALRLFCSGGPLWVDEIWSLRNLQPISHFWQVLWDISHDNNHFANSIWLFFALPVSDNSTWLRLPSILAGAFAIPVMARLGARSGPAAALAAAALTAASFFQLTYSLEARGYACATLAVMIAYDALERAIDDPQGRARYVLAAAAGLGLFCHLAVGPAIVLLGLIGFGELLRRERDAPRAILTAVRIFWPAALAMLPATLCVLAGYVVMGGFTIGAFRPYAASHAIGAIGNMAMSTFGLSPESPFLAARALVVLPILIVGAITLAPAQRRIAYCAALIGVPASVFILHPANSHPPRYFFVCSVFLLLLAADAFGALWRMSPRRRVAALAALIGVLIGDATSAARFVAGKAATWEDALAAIRASGEPRLASNFDFNVGKQVDYFDLRRGAALDLVHGPELCARPPAWYVVEGAEPPTTSIEVAGEGCRLSFELVGVYGRHLPDQLPWALYRRSEGAAGADVR
jgi:hypothetical protein